MDRIVGGKYKLGRKIGSGSFGEIFLGERIGASVPLPSPPIRLIDRFLLFSSVMFLFTYSILISVFISSVPATHVDTLEIVAVKIVSYPIFLGPFLYLVSIPICGCRYIFRRIFILFL